MKTRVTLVGRVVISCLLWMLAPAASAQEPDSQKSVSTGPVPRFLNGQPDLSGVWQVPYVPDMTVTRGDQRGTAELPFTSWGRENWEIYDPADGDYTGSCMPFGFSRAMNAPYPFQIMQSDTYVTLLFELNTWFHVIPIEGRSHPDDLNPTWFGHSVGRWEGDTLVVETKGFNGYTRLDTIGHPHSDELRLVQTFERTDAGHIEYTVTVDDPIAYTEPWTNERTFSLMDGELIEYSCEENNRSLWEGRIKQWYPPWFDGPR